MNRKLGVLACSLLLTLMAAAQAPKAKAAQRTVTELLNGNISNMEHEFIPAADAMPEDKFNFAPTNGEFKGARTYAQQIKHVAAVNYELAAALLEQKPPVDIGDESGPASLTTKSDIMKYLKDSFEYVHKALATVNDENLTEDREEPLRRRIRFPPGTRHVGCIPRLRSLWPDGGVSSHERHRPPIQPYVMRELS